MANKAYTELRKKILTNQLPAGTRFKEEIWARKLQVSRMSVREALNRLLGEGLVITGEKGGYFLDSITETDIHQLRELRELLEIGAFKLLSNKITNEQIIRLTKICDDFKAMANEGYVAGACEADMKFHETLIEFTGNQKLVSTYASSHIPLFHKISDKTNDYLENHETIDTEHRQLIEAIVNKNLHLFEIILNKHLSRGEKALLYQHLFY
ncbi:MAG: GntR family transcriptional regulator [Chitinophagaceae bacterium]